MSPVSKRTVATVIIGERDAGKATEKISSNNSLSIVILLSLSLTGDEGLEIFIKVINAINPEVTIIDQADPTSPSLGRPNDPNINPAEKKTCIPAQITVRTAGNCISPIPLRAAVKLPDSQTTIAPNK